MEETRIDELRASLNAIGNMQITYTSFFKSFATKLEESLGAFLGSPSDVALCNNTGDFNFDNGSYVHQGLGFENGEYRIPLMLRIRHTKDDGAFLLRFRIFCKLDDTNLAVRFGDTSEIRTLPLNDMEGLLDQLNHLIFEHLRAVFSPKSWLKIPSSDYQGTHIGFC